MTTTDNAHWTTLPLTEMTGYELVLTMRRAGYRNDGKTIGACRAELNRRVGVVTAPAPASADVPHVSRIVLACIAVVAALVVFGPIVLLLA